MEEGTGLEFRESDNHFACREADLMGKEGTRKHNSGTNHPTGLEMMQGVMVHCNRGNRPHRQCLGEKGMVNRPDRPQTRFRGQWGGRHDEDEGNPCRCHRFHQRLMLLVAQEELLVAYGKGAGAHHSRSEIEH